MDEAYEDGEEVNIDVNEGDPERIQWQLRRVQVAMCDHAGLRRSSDVEFDYGGKDVEHRASPTSHEPTPGKITLQHPAGARQLPGRLRRCG